MYRRKFPCHIFRISPYPFVFVTKLVDMCQTVPNVRFKLGK